MLALSDLFVHLYVLIDDTIQDDIIAIPALPGPAPACSDAEVLTITLARHLQGVTSENVWLAQVRAHWRHYFPHLPAQSEFNRRVRWCWGALELLRQHLIAEIPEDRWQQVDTTSLPLKHPSRVRGPHGWVGPLRLRRCASRVVLRLSPGVAHRLGISPGAGLGDRPGVGGRARGGGRPAGGYRSARWSAAGPRLCRSGLCHSSGGTWHPGGAHPSQGGRRRIPLVRRRPVAVPRKGIETTNGEITENLGLAHHRAHTFWVCWLVLPRRCARTPCSSWGWPDQRTHITRLSACLSWTGHHVSVVPPAGRESAESV
jgi:hypothetical protein